MLWHRESLVSNQSIVNLEDITGGSDLLCLTNTATCCRGRDTGSTGVGFWYFPDGSVVPSDNSNGLSRDRGTSFVALTHSGSGSPPSGLYRCEIPDSEGQTVTLFAGVYRSGLGKSTLYLLLRG